ncbi:MAG: hypothetical protein H0X30_28560 [Anaerolineae bacterium]|nr:hypothetical protein [Anaerolineae bacterium]
MPRLSVWIIRSALMHLGIGITLGTLMLWNKGSLFDARIWLLVSTHLELLIVGWLMQLALGVAFWILPRFTHEPRYGNVRRGWGGFILLNSGILLVILGIWLPDLSNLQPIGRLVELLSVITLASVLWPRVKPFGV